MSAVEVDVQIACRAGGVPAAAELAAWARAALGANAGQPLAVTVRVVGEREGRRLNRAYRSQPHATNVLSFPFESPPGVDLPLLGDVVICAPVVAREALRLGCAPAAHWAHMVVHGALHLLGHDHEEAESAGRMEALEGRILAELGFPDPYTDPA